MNPLKFHVIYPDFHFSGRHPARYVLCAVIVLYHFAISPFLGPCCRFYPSCSVYAAEAVMKYGVFRGGWMALKRLLKCHPFHPGGVDLVP